MHYSSYLHMARDENIYTQFSGLGLPETASWNKCRHISPEVSQLEMSGNWKALTETKHNGCQTQWTNIPRIKSQWFKIFSSLTISTYS